MGNAEMGKILEYVEKLFAMHDRKCKETEKKMYANEKMALEDRIHYTIKFCEYNAVCITLNEIISLIKSSFETEKFWEEKKQEQCNCEKNHNRKEHTKEDDEEFTKIKKQLEVLKQYISDEIKGAIDNMNFWYERQTNEEQCSLNDYKKYIKTILVVVYNTKREADVWNKIMEQINIISKMIKIEE